MTTPLFNLAATVLPMAVGGQIAEPAMFWALALLTGISSIGVALTRDIVRTAVWLLMALLGVAGIYLLLDAQFLAALQLVVYAGGTLVVIVFGVMLTSQSPLARLRPTRLQLTGALIVGLLLLAAAAPALVGLANARATNLPPRLGPPGTAMALGREFFGADLVPFELASVILLVVMIGAAYLARGRRAPRGRGANPAEAPR